MRMLPCLASSAVEAAPAAAVGVCIPLVFMQDDDLQLPCGQKQHDMWFRCPLTARFGFLHLQCLTGALVRI
jgi:hypothetical protein